MEISLDEARARVLALDHPLPSEIVPLYAALGRVLAEDIVADSDLPPFANSAMDGFAVRADDTAGALPGRPVRLRIIGAVGAGSSYMPSVGPGEAASIGTGAPLPPGSNAVLQAEDTVVEGDAAWVTTPVQPGHDVRPVGEDVRTGGRSIARGATLRPYEIALLAALGRERVAVGARPRVALVTTGDELIGPTEPLTPGRIRDANLPGLCAQAAEAGCEPVALGRAPDNLNVIAARLAEGLAAADALVVSAGISAGARDYVREALSRLGTLANADAAGSALRVWKRRKEADFRPTRKSGP
ncbi:MAG: hypothetical protein GEU73_09575 [Chloroflexi bacterium]|nr:hypothetical protein [Chloroflexota bacterium]